MDAIFCDTVLDYMYMTYIFFLFRYSICLNKKIYNNNMSDYMDEIRYGRLCLLILKTCPERLRCVIDYFYRRGVPSFETFLNNKLHDLFHLRFRKCCCGNCSRITPITRFHWDLLYSRIPKRTWHGPRRETCPCQYHVRTGVTSDLFGYYTLLPSPY